MMGQRKSEGHMNVPSSVMFKNLVSTLIRQFFCLSNVIEIPNSLPNQKLITDPVKAADMFCISSKSHRGGNDLEGQVRESKDNRRKGVGLSGQKVQI
jgi:hypothetical protein